MTHIFALVSGLGLFLYGMKAMSDGLELTAGRKLRRMLEVLTSNKFVALLVGVSVTAVIQSSSATTVMVVSFVNAGLMSLTQAVGVIMGANIGTTVTSWLVALNPQMIAPFAILGGVVCVSFIKKKQVNHIGMILCGLGILFLGLNMMSDALAPLREYQPFLDLMVTFGKNPLLGVLAGVVVTAIIQSSSASVAILQALAAQGLVPLNAAVYILCGQNIGTCVTALLASAGASKTAKRASVLHLLFNVMGTLLFGGVLAITELAGRPFFIEFVQRVSGDAKVQIAVAHLVFNLLTTAVLFPLSNVLVRLSQRIVPGEDKKDNALRLEYITESLLNTPMIAAAQAVREAGRMAELARLNLETAFQALIRLDETKAEEVLKREKVIDYLNHTITDFLVKLSATNLSDKDNQTVGALYHVVNDLERIGDHAENLAEETKDCLETGVQLPQESVDGLQELYDRALLVFRSAAEMFRSLEYDQDKADSVSAFEQDVDDAAAALLDLNIAKLNEQAYTAQQGMVIMRTISNLERVADHSTNIAFALHDSTGAEFREEEQEQ